MRIHIIILFGFLLFSCNQPEQTKNNEVETASSAEIKSLNALIAKNSKKASLYFERANQFVAEKNFAAAQDDMLKALELDKDNETYKYTLAEIAFGNNDVSLAQATLKELIAKNSKNKEAYLFLAKIQLVLRDYDPAKKTISNLTENLGESVNAFFLAGMVAKETLDTNSAIALFQKAVALDNDFYDAYAQLGLIFQLKQDRRGLDYLNNAIRIDEFSTESLYARALLYQSFKEYDKASKDYRKILEINPEYAAAYYNMGIINFKTERFETALELFNQAVITDERYANAYYMRGLTQEAMQNLSAAAENYRFCLKLDPAHKGAKEGLHYLSRTK
jgi:Tfp pilus assembly protein PilF